MKIKTNDGEMNVTGYGQGVYNTVGASAGIAALLGLGNNNGCGNNGGLLGNLFGGNNNNCCGCPVSEKELRYASALAACQAHSDALATAREEDAKIFRESRRSDERIESVVKDTTEALIKTGVAVAENSKALECLKVEVQRNREEAKSYTDNRVTQEAQLRKAADDNIAAWTQAELNKKISGHLTINGDDICYHSCKPVMCNSNCMGTQLNPVVVTEAKPAK